LFPGSERQNGGQWLPGRRLWQRAGLQYAADQRACRAVLAGGADHVAGFQRLLPDETMETGSASDDAVRRPQRRFQSHQWPRSGIRPIWQIGTSEVIGWISIVRPSRQLLRSFLRIRKFLNAIKEFLILRRPQGGRLEGRTAAMQPICSKVMA